MPKITSFWEGYICGLSDSGMSYSVIIKRCQESGLKVSKGTITSVIKRNKNIPPDQKGIRATAPRNRAQPSRTPRTIAKVKAFISQENPPTQSSMAKRCGISGSTVRRIISDNLHKVVRHKRRGHRLTSRHVRERCTNARKLYEGYLAGDKWKWVVSLDEAWMFLDDTNKPRSIFYQDRNGKGRSEFVRQNKEKFSKGFMVVAGYCARGRLELFRVSGNAKINSMYFQENVMDRIYNRDIPRLYANEANKVFIHMDKASSHTSRSSTKYYETMAAKTGIRVIPFSSIPVKSPDASPLDFCGFGLLKSGIARRRPKTVDGLWKVCQHVWNSIPQDQLRRSLLQWKLRCRAIVKMRGNHIENDRWWRRGIS